MMQKKKNRIIGLILVGNIISIMVLVTFYIGYNMEQKLREKLKLDIQKVAEQNAEAVGRTLETHAKLLQNLSKRIALRPEEQRNDYVKELRTLVQLQGYKRMAYVKNDGSFLTTDNYKGNFGKKAFLKKACEAKSSSTRCAMTSWVGPIESMLSVCLSAIIIRTRLRASSLLP